MSYVKSPIELGIDTICQGIYIETNHPRIDAMIATGRLEFGVGDTRTDAKMSTIESRMRGHETSKNLGWQHYLLDSIPNPGYRDYALHKEISKNFAAQLKNPITGKLNEVFVVKVPKPFIKDFKKSKDFEPIRVWLNENIRKCASKLNKNHMKESVNLRNLQKFVIKKIMTKLIENENDLAVNFVCELAPRLGKTILFLSLSKNVREEFGHQSMFVMAYGVGLSVKTSYKDEISKYSDFANMRFIDAADVDAEKQYNDAYVNNFMPIVFVSLNPEAEEKYNWINKLDGRHLALLEETDFGTHTDSQVKKVEYILANKTVTRINSSGTNIGRLAKAFGKNVINEVISIPYCMVEQDRSIPNVVIRRFYNMLFNEKINKLLKDFDKDLLPNITKILSKPLSQQKFISALFQDMLGYQSVYGFNISEQAEEEILNLMLFVNVPKKAMEQLGKIIEKSCPEHKVLILNGDYTDNKSAEGLTKQELVRLKEGYYPGRDKLIVITNMMGTRSYTVPEIQACLFMQEGGDVYPYMQKYSRCLSPGFGKKFGHIFDFSFDQSKTRNTVTSVVVEAALLIRQKNKTFPDAVREVLNSVNIKDMVSGQWINSDDIIKQFEDNDKLLEIANANTRITIEDLTIEEKAVFGELAKRFTSSKIERSKIDNLITTGKTFAPAKTARGRPSKNPMKAVVEKATRMINGSATTVLALSNYRGESFLDCVRIIAANDEMALEFFDLYGIYPDTIERLSHLLQLPTLDSIVLLSKYNNTQKHVENNSLGIIKDNPILWREILNNRKLKSFIKSKRCKKILVVAGGHGSEIDELVEMFGVDILSKIVYNDKYTFLCNQIKRKYPQITVMKGDFIELEFNMKFDVIIGNPPYQKQVGPNKTEPIWDKFVIKSLELLKKGGYLVLIHPAGWRNVTGRFSEGRDLLLNKNMQYLEIHNEKDGMSTFGAKTRYDWYVLENTEYSGKTQVVFEDGTEKVINLNKLRFIPNHSLDLIQKLLAKPGEETVEILHSKSAYETRKNHVNDTKTTKFKYPVVQSVKMDGSKVLRWSSINDKGHFGIPKFVFCQVRIGSSETFVDIDGEYGLTQFACGIVDEVENLTNIKKAYDSAKFQNLMWAMATTGFPPFRHFELFRKDFWKEFV